jgi:predicted CopG family antitoxin
MEKEEKPVPSSEELEKEWEERKPYFMKSMKAQVAGPKATKESWSGMVRELINKKNLKLK